MKKLIYLILITIIISSISCDTEPTAPVTIIDIATEMDAGYYYHREFNLEKDEEISIDLKVTEGGPVDLLLMNDENYQDFMNRLEFKDTITTGGMSLPEGYYAYLDFGVEEGDSILFWISSNFSLDVFLLNDENFQKFQNGETFSSYREYLNIPYVSFLEEFTQTEVLHLVLDNTSYFGSPASGSLTFSVIVGFPKSYRFDYFEDGSRLSTRDSYYKYTATEGRRYYLVVNNSGLVEDGAFPYGPVEFELIVKK